MATFNDWNSLKKAIQQEMRNAMSETESKSYLDALHNNSDYYFHQLFSKVFRILVYILYILYM